MKSMTGYGRARLTVNNRDITAEIRAVNHRYFDCSVKAPRIYGFLEDAVKSAAGSKISRGKIDIFISVDSSQCGDIKITLNNQIADGYFKALTELQDKYGLKDDISVMGLARMPEIFSTQKEEADAEALTRDVLTVLNHAIAEFEVMRDREGKKLEADIRNRCETIISLVKKVEERSPQSVAEYRAKLTARMNEILADTTIDSQRILAEAAIFADRVAVDEETVRLRSHIHQLEIMLTEKIAVGRKLDFLVQEMNREANTIGSKANDFELSKIVVDLKAEIEKIREQVQNIE